MIHHRKSLHATEANDSTQLDVDIAKSMRGQGPSLDLEVSFRTSTPTTVIFGPSGSGKTTLLRSVAGLVRPDRGHIAFGPLVFYDSSSDISLPPFQRRLGMVFQQPSLFVVEPL